MNKNYYEILEINKNASPEIVKKAYQTLVKMYHPDLQQGEKKAEYEEKLKLINEAYEVLVDPNKRKEYDEALALEEQKNAEPSISQQDYDKLYRQKMYMEQVIENLKAAEAHQNEVNNTNNVQNVRNTQNRQNVQYVQRAGTRNYRVKRKKTFRDYMATVITIIVVLIVLWILWHLPPIHNQLVELYNSDPIIRSLANAIYSVFHPDILNP